MSTQLVVRIGVRELEARLGVDRSTIWRWYRASKFPAPHYLADRRVWLLSDVEAWEGQQMARAPEARRGARNLTSECAGLRRAPADLTEAYRSERQLQAGTRGQAARAPPLPEREAGEVLQRAVAELEPAREPGRRRPPGERLKVAGADGNVREDLR